MICLNSFNIRGKISRQSLSFAITFTKTFIIPSIRIPCFQKTLGHLTNMKKTSICTKKLQKTSIFTKKFPFLQKNFNFYKKLPFLEENFHFYKETFIFKKKISIFTKKLLFLQKNFHFYKEPSVRWEKTFIVIWNVKDKSLNKIFLKNHLVKSRFSPGIVFLVIGTL